MPPLKTEIKSYCLKNSQSTTTPLNTVHKSRKNTHINAPQDLINDYKGEAREVQ